MNNPYEESNKLETMLHEQLKHITCPHCQATNDNLDMEEYYTKSPPLRDTMVVSWDCETCANLFKTIHELDNEGNIKRSV